MSILPASSIGDESTGFYPETIDQSVRFNDGDSPYLSRTFGTATSTTQGTWSCWFKRGDIDARGILWSASNYEFIDIQASGQIVVPYLSNLGYVYTNGRFRDPTNWYNLVVTFDTPNATEADRLRIYVNGVRQEVYDSITLTQNATFQRWNVSGYTGHIGNFQYNNTLYFDGYLAECNWIDGTALEPSSFGETKNGVWIPKAISGLTYGNNGFRLTFADSSSLGDDTSGNGNDFSSSGLASTDVVPDSPTNNFATFNSLDIRNNAGLSEGNTQLDATTYSGGNFGQCTLTIPVPTSGKWYIECHVETSGTYGNLTSFGVVDRDDMVVSAAASNYYNTTGLGFTGQVNQPYLTGTSNYFFGASDGAMINSYVDRSFTAQEFVCALAIDVDNGYIYIGRDAGVGNTGSQITWRKPSDGTTGTSNVNPESGSSGTGGIARTFNNNTVIVVDVTVSGDNASKVRSTINAGQDSSFAGKVTAQSETDENGKGDFYYSVPSGYLALCSSNLPDTTLSPNQSEQATDYFNTVLYTGNGSTQSITGVGFAPDWVWIKERNSTSSHGLGDTSRGALKVLQSDLTDAEVTTTTNFTSFDSDGFSHGNSGRVNESGKTYVAWNWKANGGTTSSNTDGTITSTVQASTDGGFSIVTYTGTGSLGTVGHGLSSAPNMVIIKSRAGSSVPNWVIGQDQSGFTGQMYFDTGAFGSNSGSFNNTAPTNSVVTINTDNTVNQSSATYVMYCFHNVEGYSKIGSYTGNNSTDGTFVYTGFRPAWVMIKRTNGTGQWFIMDNKRIGYNGANYRLLADANSTEYTGASSNIIDIISNGFKCKTTSSNTNGSSDTYIYLAFAEQPFKFSNAR